MTTLFKVGDKVRRISGENVTTPIGFEGVIRKIQRGPYDGYVYHFDDGACGYGITQGVERWELAIPVGPVRTRKEIVDGFYGHVEVGTVINDPLGPRAMVFIGVRHSGGVLLNSDELRAAAAVLIELAEALEE